MGRGLHREDDERLILEKSGECVTLRATYRGVEDSDRYHG